jgi:hypothetical protein
VRLVWPDKQDGRRKQKRYEVDDQAVVIKYLLRQAGCLAFLNTTVDDLDGSRLSVQSLIKGESVSVLSSVPPPLTLYSIGEQNGMLLSHCAFPHALLVIVTLTWPR